MRVWDVESGLVVLFFNVPNRNIERVCVGGSTPADAYIIEPPPPGYGTGQ